MCLARRLALWGVGKRIPPIFIGEIISLSYSRLWRAIGEVKSQVLLCFTIFLLPSPIFQSFIFSLSPVLLQGAFAFPRTKNDYREPIPPTRSYGERGRILFFFTKKSVSLIKTASLTLAITVSHNKKCTMLPIALFSLGRYSTARFYSWFFRMNKPYFNFISPYRRILGLYGPKILHQWSSAYLRSREQKRILKKGPTRF